MRLLIFYGFSVLMTLTVIASAALLPDRCMYLFQQPNLPFYFCYTLQYINGETPYHNRFIRDRREAKQLCNEIGYTLTSFQSEAEEYFLREHFIGRPSVNQSVLINANLSILSGKSYFECGSSGSRTCQFMRVSMNASDIAVKGKQKMVSTCFELLRHPTGKKTEDYYKYFPCSDIAKMDYLFSVCKKDLTGIRGMKELMENSEVGERLSQYVLKIKPRLFNNCSVDEIFYDEKAQSYYCYKYTHTVDHSNYFTLDDGINACKRHDANLISINSAAEDVFVRERFLRRKDVTIETRRYMLLGIYEDKTGFHWSDNSSVDYMQKKIEENVNKAKRLYSRNCYLLQTFYLTTQSITDSILPTDCFDPNPKIVRVICKKEVPKPEQAAVSGSFFDPYIVLVLFISIPAAASILLSVFFYVSWKLEQRAEKFEKAKAAETLVLNPFEMGALTEDEDAL